ncbi:MAG: FkbM family methyltransferase [Actinomycetes bacterium]
MERLIQSLLQRTLGFDRYLFLFAWFKTKTLRWDPNERDVLQLISRMSEQSIVLDIGANIGIMTVLIAQRVRRGHVHAFEPIPENFRALTRLVAHFKLNNVTLHHMALGESSGQLEMVMPEEQHVRMQGLSHVVQPGQEVAGRQYQVPQDRLDDLEFLQDIQIDGIKIDVEGFEQFVFAGGRQLLKRCSPLVYAELVEPENRRFSCELFESLGYTVGVAQEDQIVPLDLNRHHSHNLFLIPPPS